jgi:hypothetical protein
MSGNVATLYTVEDYQGYNSFCQESNVAENNIISYKSEKIMSDEKGESQIDVSGRNLDNIEV